MIWPVTPGILSNPLPERIATIKGVKLAGENPRGIAAAAEGKASDGSQRNDKFNSPMASGTCEFVLAA